MRFEIEMNYNTEWWPRLIISASQTPFDGTELLVISCLAFKSHSCMHKSFPQTVSADTEVLLVCIFYLVFFFFPPLHKLWKSYLPKAFTRATISWRVSWKPFDGLFSGRFCISFSENKIFRAVPKPCVYEKNLNILVPIKSVGKVTSSSSQKTNRKALSKINIKILTHENCGTNLEADTPSTQITAHKPRR